MKGTFCPPPFSDLPVFLCLKDNSATQTGFQSRLAAPPKLACSKNCRVPGTTIIDDIWSFSDPRRITCQDSCTTLRLPSLHLNIQPLLVELFVHLLAGAWYAFLLDFAPQPLVTGSDFSLSATANTGS